MNEWLLSNEILNFSDFTAPITQAQKELLDQLLLGELKHMVNKLLPENSKKKKIELRRTLEDVASERTIAERIVIFREICEILQKRLVEKEMAKVKEVVKEKKPKEIKSKQAWTSEKKETLLKLVDEMPKASGFDKEVWHLVSKAVHMEPKACEEMYFSLKRQSIISNISESKLQIPNLPTAKRDVFSSFQSDTLIPK